MDRISRRWCPLKGPCTKRRKAIKKNAIKIGKKKTNSVTTMHIKDPIDIKEEITIKEEDVTNSDITIKQENVEVENSEVVHTVQDGSILIKEEDIKVEDIDLDDITLNERLISIDFEKSVNLSHIPKLNVTSTSKTASFEKGSYEHSQSRDPKNEVNLVSVQKNNTAFPTKGIKVIPLSKITIPKQNPTDPATLIPEVEIKKEPPCDCMKNVEYFCSKCNKATLYQKEIKHCAKCKNFLKLQCKLCHKKYKVLQRKLPVVHVNSVPRQREIVLLDHDYPKPAEDYQDEEQIFSCPQCMFKTASEAILNIHIAKSHNIKTELNPDDDDDMFIEFLCLKCHKTYKKIFYDNTKKQSCRDCHENMVFRCSLCHRNFKLLKNIRYHVRCNCFQRVNKEKFYCAHCAYRTEDKTRLEYHIAMKHMPKACPNCEKSFENIPDLKKHIDQKVCLIRSSSQASNNTEGTTQAIDIPQVFQRSNFARRYQTGEFIIVKNNPDVLVQNIERKPPKSKSVENWRLLIDYFCLKCGESTKKKFSKYKPWCPNCKIKYDYRCISCEKLYGAYTRIHKHVKYECDARMTYECPFCDFNCSKKTLLANHLRSKHTVFKCLRCDNNFQGLQSLKKHQSWECLMEDSHGKINLQKLIVLYCSQCSRRLPLAENAVQTQCEKCTIIMNYQCMKCNKILNNREIMYRHLKACKPGFSCDKCEFRSYSQEELDEHDKCKHITIRCPGCGVLFMNERIFKMHRLEELKKKNFSTNDCSENSANA